MQQSSSAIGSLAAARAKAQIELVNPEKSMIATIGADGSGRGEQIFRYAPLSSGLDIVRKILGKHEIAAVQATAIDHEAGIVRVTTRLCHSSGEWIAADWPVCPLDDMASPKRMGAALTYARRYALFALVGIAGEDDLDAPDLNAARVMAGLTQRQLSIEAGFNPRAAKYWESRGPTSIPENLAAIEQTLRRHGVEVFATPTPGVRLIGNL
jgi:hypothetical protein